MAKLDSKYKIVKPLLESESITSLKDLVNVVGITKLIRDTGKNYSTMHSKLFKPENLKISDCINLAEVLGLSPQQVMTLALKDINTSSKKKNSPKP